MRTAGPLVHPAEKVGRELHFEVLGKFFEPTQVCTHAKQHVDVHWTQAKRSRDDLGCHTPVLVAVAVWKERFVAKTLPYFEFAEGRHFADDVPKRRIVAKLR